MHLNLNCFHKTYKTHKTNKTHKTSKKCVPLLFPKLIESLLKFLVAQNLDIKK